MDKELLQHEPGHSSAPTHLYPAIDEFDTAFGFDNLLEARVHNLSVVAGVVGEEVARLGDADKATEVCMEAVIPAEAHTDDRAFSVRFDALPYFVTANDATLAALEVVDFAHSYEADQAARDLASEHAELAALFVYLKQVNEAVWEKIGFEVVIDVDAARSWLVANRPKVMDTIPNTQLYTVRLELEVEAPTPELAARAVRQDFPEFARFQFDIRDDEDQLLLLVDAEAAAPRLAKRIPTARAYERTTFTDRERDLIDAEMARLAAEEEE